MKTTTFDATELGLLSKYDFQVLTDDVADKELGDTYFQLAKITSTLIHLRKEQGNSVKINSYTTIREALKTL